jgi:ribosome-associated protein
MSDNPFPENVLPLACGAFVRREDLKFTFSRSGGPGGQNVNKVNTKAELRVKPDAIQGLSWRARERLIAAAQNRMAADGSILIVSDEERSQDRNRHACQEKLCSLVGSIARDPKPRFKTRPTRASKLRRIESKKARSAVKKMRSRGYED